MSLTSLDIQQPGISPRVARFRYSKVGKIRFTSHRDVGRMWERALRKVSVAVAYTSGFSPRPRVAFGFALPTGAESVAEYVDVALALDKAHEVGDLPERLTPALPDGLEVTDCALLPASTPALQAAVTSSTWRITLPTPNFGGLATLSVGQVPEVVTDWADRLAELLDRPTVEIEVERKGASVPTDIRPGILAADVVDDGVISCDLSAKGTRPADFLRALGADPLDARLLRTQQWIDHDAGRAEPLAAVQPFSVLREDPIADVRPQPVTAVSFAPSPARLARGA